MEIIFLANNVLSLADGAQERILVSLDGLYKQLSKYDGVNKIKGSRKDYAGKELQKLAESIVNLAHDLENERRFRTEIRFITRAKGTQAEGLLNELKRLLWRYRAAVIRGRIGKLYLALAQFKSIQGSAKVYRIEEIVFYAEKAVDAADRLKSEVQFQVAMAHITGGGYASAEARSLMKALKKILWLYREAIIEIRRKPRAINIEDRILPEDPDKRWLVYEKIELGRRVFDESGATSWYEVDAGFRPKSHPDLLKCTVRGVQRSRRWVPYFVDKDASAADTEKKVFKEALAKADDVARPYYFFTRKDAEGFYALSEKGIISLWSLLDGLPDAEEMDYEEYAIFGFERPSDTTLGLWTFSICEVRDTLTTAENVYVMTAEGGDKKFRFKQTAIAEKPE